MQRGDCIKSQTVPLNAIIIINIIIIIIIVIIEPRFSHLSHATDGVTSAVMATPPAPDVIASVLGLVGPESVHCHWSRQQI